MQIRSLLSHMTHRIILKITLGLIILMSNIIHSASYAQNTSVISPQVPSSISQNMQLTPEMEAQATKRINRLSDELKSPFCPGKTLLTCTSPEAFKLRREMRQLIFKGYSDDQILEELRDTFGERLENPPQPWFTVIIPILPFIFGGLLALGMFIYWLYSSKKSEQTSQNEDEEIHDERHYERLRALLNEED